MPQIKRIPALGLVLLIGLFLSLGCGSSSNSPSAIDPVKPGHPDNWIPAGHVAAAASDVTSCAQCHGADFSGGISMVPCTRCHLGNAQAVHPLDWDNLVGVRHAGYVKSNGNSSCSNIFCHGANLTGVADSGPSCSSCHLGGPASVHPLDWGTVSFLKHPAYVASNGTAACSNAVCHGPSLGGVADSGPACSSCHLDGPTSVHPLEWGTLTYVRHAAYVASNGTGTCSNAGCHGPSLSGVAGSGPSCSSCHIGGPTAVHPADWTDNILQHRLYVGSRGTASCSNVVCHGPQLQGVSLSGPSCFICHQL